MTNFDTAFEIKQLKEQVAELRIQIAEINNPILLENQDWDNATLMIEWDICERTAANYRQQGLDYFKRGGRIFYTPKARSDFKRRNKNK